MQLTGRNLHIVYNYYSHDTDANDYVERDHDALVVQACLPIKGWSVFIINLLAVS